MSANSFTAGPGEMSYDAEREPRMTPPECRRDPAEVIKRLRRMTDQAIPVSTPQTEYAIRSTAGVWWQGLDRWTIHESDARRFASMTEAQIAALLECDRPVHRWTVEAVSTVKKEQA